jgi:hypothetical protein
MGLRRAARAHVLCVPTGDWVCQGPCYSARVPGARPEAAPLERTHRTAPAPGRNVPRTTCGPRVTAAAPCLSASLVVVFRPRAAVWEGWGKVQSMWVGRRARIGSPPGVVRWMRRDALLRAAAITVRHPALLRLRPRTAPKLGRKKRRAHARPARRGPACAPNRAGCAIPAAARAPPRGRGRARPIVSCIIGGMGVHGDWPGGREAAEQPARRRRGYEARPESDR